MNIFRLCGDMSHLLAIIILLLKIWKTRSCAGLSGKTQILFLILFVSRYLDLVIYFISLYNTVMKIIFITSSAVTIYMIYFKFRATYDSNHDTFRMEFLLVPVAGLAFFVNHEFVLFEILWTFSIYLESVAILPQLFMISKRGEAESIISHYLFALGSYRALYILHWVYRFYIEGTFDLIAIVAGCVQTLVSILGTIYALYKVVNYDVQYEKVISDTDQLDHRQTLLDRVYNVQNQHRENHVNNNQNCDISTDLQSIVVDSNSESNSRLSTGNLVTDGSGLHYESVMGGGRQ